MVVKELIGIGGYKGVGKNTASAILRDEYGFKEISLALPLKKICAELTGLPYAHFEEQHIKDEPFSTPLTLSLPDLTEIVRLARLYGTITPEQKDSILDVGFRVDLLTPRHMLQFVGTDLIRKHVDSEFWCRAYEKEVKQHQKVVSPDVRFENERRTVRNLGGKMVLIKRPGTLKGDTHASENDYGFDMDYSYVFVNDGSIADLHNSVKEWYANVKPLLILGL